MKRLAVYGGSFDPITKAHYDIILELCSKYDFVLILPTYIAKLKDCHFFNFTQRCDFICKLKLPSNCIVSNIEYTYFNSFQGKTFEAIEYLKRKYKEYEISLVIGTDQLTNIDKWFNWKDLISSCKFCVISRDADIPLNYPWIANIEYPTFLQIDTVQDCSSTKLRKAIIQKDFEQIERLSPAELFETYRSLLK